MISRVSLITAFLAAGLVLVGNYVGDRPRVVYHSAKAIVALESDCDGLLWLAKSDEDTAGSLFALDRGSRSPRLLHPEPRLTEFALAGDRVLAFRAAGQTAELLSLPRAGGEPSELVGGLSRPRGLAADGRAAYWTESRPAAAPHVWHIPVLRPRTCLRACSLAGEGARRTIAVAEADEPSFGGSLLGVHEGRLYWLDTFGRSLGAGWSAIRSVSVDGGQVETVAVEGGRQAALLDESALYWTAPSEDAWAPLAYSCVRRTSLPHIAPVTLTDWLMGGGRLLLAGGQLHYAASDGVWAVPHHLGEPRQLNAAGGGSSLVAGSGGWVYQALSTEEGGSLLLRHPVTLAARLRAAVGLP